MSLVLEKLRTAVLSLLSVLTLTVAVDAASPVVVSQVYGGGGNSGATFRNDFFELFNRGPVLVDLSSWSVQYASASGTSWQRTNLVGVIAPGGYYLVQEAQGSGGTVALPTPDATGTIAMSATAGKVALLSDQTTIASGTSCPSGGSLVDLVGFGAANCHEGVGPVATLSNTTAALRLANGCTDTDANAVDFATGAPAPRNSLSPASPCLGPTAPTAVGTATPASVLAGGTTLLTVTVVPGTHPPSSALTVTADLTPIGGAAAQALFDDGTHGDASAGDLAFTYGADIAAAAPRGSITLQVVVRDGELRQGTATISLSVAPPPVAIHVIQGSGSRSTMAGTLATTRGVVTGRKSNGFFIQTPDAEVDDDPTTSEGLFVFTSATPPADAAVGNEVQVTGTVQEFVPAQTPTSPPLTELTSPTVTLLATAQPLPEAITITEADTDPAGGPEQLERLEGMRVHVASLTVVGPTDGNLNEAQATSTSNGVFYGVVTGVARPFRGPGVEVGEALPADAPCCIPRYDGNPERLRIDSDGLVGASRWDVASGDVLTDLVGVLDYSFRTYSVLPEPGTPARLTERVAVALPEATVDEFTVASANLERFFDGTNDPDISDPVLTATAFENRLRKASLSIRGILRSPDIVGLQEIENLATLQTLASRLNADAVAAGDPDPGYAAFLDEGNDPGGIDAGLLVKTSRVGVIDVVQEGKDAVYVNPLDGVSELLNDRPPLVLRALVDRANGPDYPLTVIVNHLRSLIGLTDPTDGPRVRAKRSAQAEYLARLIQSRQSVDPTEHIVVLGDFNAYPFSDGYVDLVGTVKGVPTPPDEVLLASPDLVDPDLVDSSEIVDPEERYSYLFEGSAQQLDQVLVTANLLPRLEALRHGRVNADFPEILRNDPTRPERLSDHDPAVAYFSFPPNEPPVVDAGPDQTVSADETGQALVSLEGEASDPDGDSLTVTWYGPFGTTSGPDATVTLGLGRSEVVLTANDGRGGLSADTAIITVTDVFPPRILSVAATPSVLWPPLLQFVPVAVGVAATDAGGAPGCRITGVTSDEPEPVFGGPWSWLNQFLRDWIITGNTTVLLRAERWPWGDGRVYTIAVECRDASGNVASGTTTVTVPLRRAR